MRITRAGTTRSSRSFQHPALDAISTGSLRSAVEALAYPRHYIANREANVKARDWICDDLRSFGYRVSLQGAYDNVIAEPVVQPQFPVILLGAHYDTVPSTPGADDNNSAIAICLEAARVLALNGKVPVMIAVFNREEDGLLGSSEFVESLNSGQRRNILEAHIFEMVGYYTSEPGSQSKPAGLPIPFPDVGNFIGLLSNSRSNRAASRVLRAAKAVGSDTPLVSLKIFLGLEKRFGDLLRSDHSPFWAAGMPALMWTDTSNFRNPHYHLPSDTPDTLNYDALADVARIIVGHVLRQTSG